METKSPETCPYSVTVRRNPHRKARPTTLRKCQQHVSVPPPEVPSFPIDDILAMEVPQNPNPNPNSDSVSENLKVFLRIRPILPSASPAKDQNLKPRSKNAWPKNPAKKNPARERAAKKKSSGEVCITVNDSQSVTLSPPLVLQESKRIKSEVYEGFSHVFAPDSSQEQVFEKMVCPLVDDFLRGKSGMLAALGPSGSGKTHTVFGSPRDPGFVPRILQRIFRPNSDTASESRRSFSISIFEIHSERSKGEKLFDLCPGGAELNMQQSTIKGLQEEVISDAREAESFVAQAMLRRLTAMTNSNCQSSRSQCVINIRSVANHSSEKDDFSANNAVLSIIDLAGAEREKKTGNQGARLLESNFINNTSMVFGLCLRSLLEHQKNPRKPLQKHFQNSLLTRYLRDYLEGKKRMTLILTVKSGEEDYLDTTYLLRQASPLMRIRFHNVEEQANISCNKRQSQALSRRAKPKRMRFSGSDSSAIEEKKIAEDERFAPVQGCLKVDIKSDFPESSPLEVNNVILAKSERSYQILQSVAKALWTVLKQHGKQLKVAEHEIQHLSENIKLEKLRNIELERQLEDLKSCCTCSQQKFFETALAESETNVNHKVELDRLHPTNFDESSVDLCSSKFRLPDCNGSHRKHGSSPRQDHTISSQKNLDIHSSSVRASEADRTCEKCDSNSEQNLDIFSQVKEEAPLSGSKDPEYIYNRQVFDSPVTSLDVEVVDDSPLSVESLQQQYQGKEEASPLGSKALEHIANGQVTSLDVKVVDGSSLCFERSQQKYQVKETSPSGSKDLECINNGQVFDAPVKILDVEVVNGSSFCFETSQQKNLVKEKAFSSDSNELECVDNEPEFDNLVRVDVVDGSSLCVEISPQKHQIDDSFCGSGHDAEGLHDSRCFETDDICTTADVTDHTISLSQPLVVCRDDSCSSVELHGRVGEKVQELLNLPKIAKVDIDIDIVDGNLSRIEKPVDYVQESLDPLTSVKEDLAVTEDCKAANAPNTKQRVEIPSKARKPNDSCLSVELRGRVGEKDQELLNLPKIGKVDGASSIGIDIVDGNLSRNEKPVDCVQESLDPLTSVKEDLAVTEDCKAANAPNTKQRVETPSKARIPNDSCLSVELHGRVGEKDQELLNLPKIGKVDGASSIAIDIVDGNLSRFEKPVDCVQESLDPLTSVKEDLAVTEDCKAANAPNTKQRVDTPSKAGKPKRRLLPASSALLRDFNTLDIGDNSERPKGRRGGKKVSGDERNRTQGSISLLRMLNSNIRV